MIGRFKASSCGESIVPPQQPLTTASSAHLAIAHDRKTRVTRGISRLMACFAALPSTPSPPTHVKLHADGLETFRSVLTSPQTILTRRASLRTPTHTRRTNETAPHTPPPPPPPPLLHSPCVRRLRHIYPFFLLSMVTCTGSGGSGKKRGKREAAKKSGFTTSRDVRRISVWFGTHPPVSGPRFGPDR